MATTPLRTISPGARGINTESGSVPLDPGWALTATNAIIDASGNLSKRPGLWSDTGGSASVNNFVQTIKFVNEEQSTTTAPMRENLFIGWGGGATAALRANSGLAVTVGTPTMTAEAVEFFDSTGSYDANDVIGSQDPEYGRWNIQVVNNVVYALTWDEACTTPFIKRNPQSDTNFQLVSFNQDGSYTFDNGVAASAFGRLWIKAGPSILLGSALLDPTEYRAANDGVEINMANVWPNDEIMAITEFNGALVVFGRDHIVFWVDGTGSRLGIDPDNMYVSDIISGTGCAAERTLAKVGETDILFLSRNGVQSLGRVIQERSNPSLTLTDHVRSEITGALDLAIKQGQFGSVSPVGTYNHKDGNYYLSFGACGINKTYVLNYRRRFLDDSTRIQRLLCPVTVWSCSWRDADVSTITGLMVVSGLGTSDTDVVQGGRVSIPGFQDYYSDGSGLGGSRILYGFQYQSPALSFGGEVDARLKIPKRADITSFVSAATSATCSWQLDYSAETGQLRTITINPSDAAEWGVSEWGVGEYGSSGVAKNRAMLSGEGDWIQIGIDHVDPASTFALREITIHTKLGRLA